MSQKLQTLHQNPVHVKCLKREYNIAAVENVETYCTQIHNCTKNIDIVVEAQTLQRAQCTCTKPTSNLQTCSARSQGRKTNSTLSQDLPISTLHCPHELPCAGIPQEDATTCCNASKWPTSSAKSDSCLKKAGSIQYTSNAGKREYSIDLSQKLQTLHQNPVHVKCLKREYNIAAVENVETYCTQIHNCTKNIDIVVEAQTLQRAQCTCTKPTSNLQTCSARSQGRKTNSTLSQDLPISTLHCPHELPCAAAGCGRTLTV